MIPASLGRDREQRDGQPIQRHSRHRMTTSFAPRDDKTSFAPQDDNKLFTKRYPELFPVDKDGKPTTDHVMKLLDVKFDPSLLPKKLTLRDFNQNEADVDHKDDADLTNQMFF